MIFKLITIWKGDSQICLQIRAMKDPEQLAEALFDYLEKAVERNPEASPTARTVPDKINKIYIASPPSEVALLDQARSRLNQITSKYAVYLQTGVSSE